MPELPEVEVLVRHLPPLLMGQVVLKTEIRRERVVRPTSPNALAAALQQATFTGLERRGKYLIFTLLPAGRTVQCPPARKKPSADPAPKCFLLVGHLGMTGRMYLLPNKAELPKHAAVVLHFRRRKLVFEDTRYFGRFTLDTSGLDRLGPEPMLTTEPPEAFVKALRGSRQLLKARLLDQRVVAGVGNIYASEAMFRAGISPRARARALKPCQVARLWSGITEVLTEAIENGSTVPLDFPGTGKRDNLFYFGRAPGAPDYYAERLRVYDREGQPCVRCQSKIRRIVQGGRSTFFCPVCQPGYRKK